MTAPRILIIDDDPDFVEIIKTILETKQYDVRYAHSPAEGIARLEEELPHLVILDIMMGKGPLQGHSDHHDHLDARADGLRFSR
jgi:CheY-like chemotaxis protein